MLVKSTDKRIAANKEEEVLAELQRIYKANESKLLMPEDVVDAARDPDNPLHSKFEWDDGIAAEKFRLNQARTLIVHFRVTIDDKQAPSRVFFSLSKDRAESGGYRTMPDILKSHKVDAKATAVAELEAWCRRHEVFCGDMVAAVRKAAAKFA